MDVNKISDSENESSIVENSNLSQAQPNISSEISNSSSCPELSNLISPPSSSGNHSQSRDCNLPEKRSHPENGDKDCQSIKRKIPDEVGNEKDSDNDERKFPVSQMISTNYQAPISTELFVTSSSNASAIVNDAETVSPTNRNSCTSVNVGGNVPSLYPMEPRMFSVFQYAYPSDDIVPMFNNLEPIVINRAVLTPPSEKTHNRRPKPPGCRTVFVGNLPEKISEEIIREAFKICGTISIVRMNKKFCHIRFLSMESVDQAVLLSGFHIRIDENDEPAFNGTLVVHYASARDDHYDHECLTRVRLPKEEIVSVLKNLEPIVINHAVLTPPRGGLFKRRPQPPGCKTVYVGGLPEKISEEIIRETFKICGTINEVRMSKKFCHITFESMESANEAVLFSGFRIRIDESDESAFNAKLYVDYVSAREGYYDFERLERLRLQEEKISMFTNLEPMVINRAVLTPPPPGKTHNRRPKPPGCRTVFVGNLPEKISEEIIREAFKICGTINVVRMNKNFCHIRFESMESVDQALLLSGFHIRIDDNDEPTFNGSLVVDYASARDDHDDYERLERATLGEEHHCQKEALSPPSPPLIPHFSEYEASILAERLHNEETLSEALQVIITWLDRRECNKRNSGTFFSLIQSSHSHVKRFCIEKNNYKEAEKANENFMNKNRSIESMINDIEKVFEATKTQKVWDHFARNQKKMMEEMENDTQDLKKANSKDLVQNEGGCQKVQD